MKLLKVALFGNIALGTRLWLTDEQARSRAHVITEIETSKRVKDRKLYEANDQLGFKAGEELAIDGDLDRGLETMFGIENDGGDDDTADKLASAQAKVDAIKGQIATFTEALAAAGSDADREKAQTKLDKAKVALTKAEAALVKLKA